MWESRAAVHHAQLAEAINPANATAMATVSQLMAGGLSQQQALAQINRMVDQQAFMLAANDIFWASSLICLALVPLVWLMRSPSRAAADAAAAADGAAGVH